MDTGTLRDSTRRSKQRRFLASFSSCGQIREAARRAKIHRDSHYAWFREDLEYRAAFLKAIPQVASMLEDEAIRRAYEGIEKPVLYHGKQVYVEGRPLIEREYDSGLLIRLLQKYDPKGFKHEQPVISIGLGDWDGDLTKLTPAQLDSLIAEMERRVAARQKQTETS